MADNSLFGNSIWQVVKNLCLTRAVQSFFRLLETPDLSLCPQSGPPHVSSEILMLTKSEEGGMGVPSLDSRWMWRYPGEEEQKPDLHRAREKFCASSAFCCQLTCLDAREGERKLSKEVVP